MTSFEKYIIYELLTNFDEAIKLRKKYTKAFDRAFKIAFGESFGAEVEISHYFYKNNSNKNWDISIDKLITKLTKLLWKKGIRIHPANYGTDCGMLEIRLPIYPFTLKYANQILNKIDKELAIKLGDWDDESTSMHIHIKPNKSIVKDLDRKSYRQINEKIYNKPILKDEELLNTIVQINRKRNINDLMKCILKTKSSLKELESFGKIAFKSNWKSIEWRIFNGSTNIQVVLFNALVSNSYTRAIYNNEEDALEFLIEFASNKTNINKCRREYYD